ncbi:TonB-dependent receptor [Stutzerimonas stutzeri]|uniref:TonB-dependent receptor n=1 Tax=Stutzerimonas stutzeri TaxID=316 RepID=UPI00265A30DA|nr:TonB-dependent siderophore receptor [Stutzerimonas stutzeri]MCF6781528.1 TonB-dependent siderophore receptor [Stutzerimonas stutzeri]MCF6804198.1 TonB-dependent siderophore receptor [Stutzerimonas stutzeri]
MIKAKNKFKYAQRHLLATAVALSVASWAGAGIAQPVQSRSGDQVELDSVTVTGEREGYKVDQASSPKYTAPLLDTPQTVTVVPQELIREQNALSLRQVLSNVSGITFAAGEGGGGLGDSINIRGFSANSNILIDGLRDTAQSSRSDAFNLESVEVVKGPSSVYSGAGTTGGSVNLVSKTPRASAFRNATLGVGTDSYKRLTADINQPLDGLEGAVFRLNLMGHENDMAQRDHIDFERWGIAPSLTFGMGTPTRLNLSYFRQSDKDMPDYGLPARDGRVLSGVDRDGFFGFRDIDTEETDVESLTIRLDHDFSDSISLSNLTRYSETERLTIISAAHVNTVGVPTGSYRPAGPQGHGRDYSTELLINQTNLSWRFNTGGIAHTLVTGVEVSREDYSRDTFSSGLPSGTAWPVYDLGNPPGYWGGPVAKVPGQRVSTELDSNALYLFDTLELSEHWQLNAGLRYERFEGSGRTQNLTAGTSERLESSDDMVSGRLGLVYKPVENGAIYLAWGNSYNPSAENLASTGSGLSADTQDLDPEENETWELGTKWELLDRRLALNAAVFRVTKTNGRIDGDVISDPVVLDGKQRVEGIELGVSGKLTDRWDIFANYTVLSSEILKAADADVAQEGQALANTPPRSFSLWTTYDLPMGFEIGYGAQYVSERNVAVSSSAKVPEYWVHSAMLGYDVSDNLSLQLNVRNLFDKEYYDRVRSNIGSDARSSALVPGEGRTAILTANLSF